MARTPTALLEVAQYAEDAVRLDARTRGTEYTGPPDRESLVIKYASAFMGLIISYEHCEVQGDTNFEGYLRAVAEVDFDDLGEDEDEPAFLVSLSALFVIDAVATLQRDRIASYMTRECIAFDYVLEDEVHYRAVIAMMKAIAEALISILIDDKPDITH
jgi:hypothetical protein